MQSSYYYELGLIKIGMYLGKHINFKNYQEGKFIEYTHEKMYTYLKFTSIGMIIMIFK